ncbi:MAG: hypothetical protein IIA62_01840 [Nitrospinae bacterium]|nr:hypothetical protein [Nitrospinota bacterium]
MVKKWMGHANRTTAENYFNAVGEEQHCRANVGVIAGMKIYCQKRP